MRFLGLIFLFCLCITNLYASAGEPIVLWPNGAPGALGKTPRDIPTLLPYLPKPETASGAALLICPGGGYFSLNQRSGTNFAAFFSEHGIVSFVLNYRLGGTNGYRWPAPFNDAQRALRVIRARADEFKINPKQVGVVGSSAAGHLAAMMLVRFDAGNPEAKDVIGRQSSRPDFGILCYPVILSLGRKHITAAAITSSGKVLLEI